MNNPVFKREDFTLCEIPVPKGYPQSQTHSGIALYDGRYYLTTSPYPVIRYPKYKTYFRILVNKLSLGCLFKPIVGEKYENPCLYVGCNVSDGIPTKFVSMTSRPLMDPPEQYYGLPSYNSDPDIFIEDGIFHILNRAVFRTKMLSHGYESITRIYLIDGVRNGERFKQTSVRLVREWDKPYASPCLTKYNGQYVFTYLDTNSAIDAETFNGLYLQQLSSLNLLTEEKNIRKVGIDCGNMLPWHMSLFQYEGILYSIVACVERGDKSRKIWQMLGVFDDNLTQLHIYSNPLTDYNSYRGAACVNEDGLFVLYNTTVDETVDGSIAVDGRNVIMSSMPFDKLLTEIEKTIP